jgi:FkbM family methyltransferase
MIFPSTLGRLYKSFLSIGRGERYLRLLDNLIFNNVERVIYPSGGNVQASFESKKFPFTIPPKKEFFRVLLQMEEPHIKTVVSRLLKPGNVYIDIGANIGALTLTGARAVGKSGQVFAFEPETYNYSYLVKNCQPYIDSGYMIKTQNIGISNISGILSLQVHELSTYHSFENENFFDASPKNLQSVEVKKLTQIVEEYKLDCIDFIKIDTEGHEIAVINGFLELLEFRLVKFLAVECRVQHICDFVDDLAKNYDLFQLSWDGARWHNCSLSQLNYKTDCLLSLNYVNAQDINELLL